jgi:hypothetical protein
MSRIGVLLLTLSLGGGPPPAQAADADKKEKEAGVVDDVLAILNQRGIVDDAEYQRLAAKNAKYEEKHKGWAPKIELGGDFRLRHESFFFDSDAAGNERDDRFRLRYRFRLDGKTEINDWASVLFQLSSGEGKDQRSNNQTLGNGVDFDPDNIQIKLAYAQLKAPSDWVPLPEGKASLELGKVPNPFLWKVGKDILLWDGDITFEGGSARLTTQASEALKLFANAGYYVIDENNAQKDPHLWAGQLGGSFEVAEKVTLGARGSYYQFNSLDSAFIGRASTGTGSNTSGAGNISNGLVGDPAGNDSLRVAELAAYLTWAGSETWPVTLYGDWATNFDAESALQASEEDTAWGVGLEVGDKKKLVLLGVGYWHIEANAFPAQFLESDVLDGFSNREGFAFYGSREVARNTELTLSFYLSDEIEDDLPTFATSVADSDRLRIQADLIFKF